MKKICFLTLLALIWNAVRAQTIHRLDGSRVNTDSIDHKARQLMTRANVSGLALIVYNDNKPVYQQTYGLADVPNHKVLTADQVWYAASFSKAVFAYIIGQLVAEKVIDLDKPLVSYLKKPLPDYPL